MADQTLSQARHSFNLLHKRVERVDSDAADRFDAFAEVFWDDQVSIEEAIVEMREICASQLPSRMIRYGG